jgi:hypothetical protein
MLARERRDILNASTPSEAGGMGIGVGEWRPEKRGEFGTYAVDVSKEIEVQN